MSEEDFADAWVIVNQNTYRALGNRPHAAIDPFGLSDSSVNACARSNPGEVGKLARELIREAERDIAKRRAAQTALRNREGLRSALGTAESQVAHHGVPFAQRGHALVKKAAEAGWNMNGKGNGMNLPKAFHKGFPNWHRNYNDLAKRMLDQELRKNPNMTSQQAADKVQGIADKLLRYAERCKKQAGY